jgi:hypothetical protein
VLLVVADGLGHGREAREAARACVATALTAAEAPDRLLRAAHDRIRGTRGSAATAAFIRAAELEVAGAGNVQAVLVDRRGGRRFGGSAFTLGSAVSRPPAFHVDRVPFARGDALVVYTDGITTRADVGAEAGAFGEHPIAIAHRIATAHARGGDDVTVAVVR